MQRVQGLVEHPFCSHNSDGRVAHFLYALQLTGLLQTVPKAPLTMLGAVGIINLNQLVPSKDDHHIQEHTGVGLQQSLSSPLSYFHSLELLLEAPIALGKGTHM